MLVSDIYDDAVEVLGNTNEDYVFRKLTDTLQLLANKNDYRALTNFINICACSDGKTLALPRFVETPQAVNIDDQPAIPRDYWYWFNLNGHGSNQNLSGGLTWTDMGFSATAMDIIKDGYIVAIADSKTDLGKKVRVYGYESKNGRWVRSQDENGNWSDGVEIPINIYEDFPSGVPTPDSQRIFVRKFTPTEILDFTSTTNHDLTTGAAVEVYTFVSPIPSPLENSETYYVQKISDNKIKFHLNKTGALTDTDEIVIDSVGANSEITVKDKRNVSVKTKFSSSNPNQILDNSRVSFEALTLPSGVKSDTDYYLRKIDDLSFYIYENADDAKNEVNKISVSSAGSSVVAQAKQGLNPYTQLVFQINHNFSTGDSVVLTNSGGSLPSPLASGTTYYVNRITGKKITLHSTSADSLTGANAVVMTNTGQGTSSVVKQISSTASTGSNNNIQATAHGFASGDFVQFSTTGTLPTPIGSGTVYLVGSPLNSDVFSLKDTSNVAVNITAVGSGQLFVVVSRAFTVGFDSNWKTDASNLSNGDIVRLDSTIVLPTTNPLVSEGTDYYVRKNSDNSIKLFDSIGNANDASIRLSASRSRTANVATINTSSNHNLTSGDFVEISNAQSNVQGTLTTITITSGGASYTAGDTVTFVDAAGNQATASVVNASGGIATVAISSGGTGYTNGATVTLVNGAKTATATISTAAGVITGFTILTSGSGFATSDALTLTGGGGSGASLTVATVSSTSGAITNLSVVNSGSGFIAAGALTISGGTGSGGTFSVATITDNINKSLSSTFNIDRVQITVTSVNSFTYASIGLDEALQIDTGATIVRSSIKVITMGAGDLFLVLRRSVTSEVAENNLSIDSAEYLKDGATVQFETDGTLPSPFLVATDYVVKIKDEDVFIETTGGTLIPVASIGSGTHSIKIEKNFKPVLPTNFYIKDNVYENGDEVVFYTEGTAPNPLINNATYYIRYIDSDTVEFYTSKSQSLAISSTTGRIQPLSAGVGDLFIRQMAPNISFTRVERIRKQRTNLFVSLYCFDNGRSGNLTNLARMFPDEIEPSYRKISLSACCSSARIAYQQRNFKIYSKEDFIPIENKQAILLMLRNTMMRGKDFVDLSEAHESKAVQYMEEEERAKRGPAGIVIQVLNSPMNDGYQMS